MADRVGTSTPHASTATVTPSAPITPRCAEASTPNAPGRGCLRETIVVIRELRQAGCPLPRSRSRPGRLSGLPGGSAKVRLTRSGSRYGSRLPLFYVLADTLILSNTISDLLA